MKTSALFTPALIAVLALSANAQQGIQTNADRKETLKVTVSGGFDMDWVYRGKELVAALGAGMQDEGRIESNANVRFDIDLSNKVSVILNLATVRLNGSYATIGQLGNGGQNVELWDAAVRIQEVLDPAITVQLGTNNDFSFDIRGRGSPLFFAPGQAGLFGDNGGSTGNINGSLDYNQVAGAVLWYNRDAAHFALALLPAIREGGAASNDEAAYAVTFYYDLDSVGKGSRIGAILAANTVSSASAGSATSSIITIGGGASLKGLGGMEGLEVFGEFYVQSGDIGTNGDAGGTAFSLGGHYDLQGEGAPWVGLEFTILSGDDDPLDTDFDQFISYEAVNDFKIIESNLFGLNIGSNYTAIKIMGGISFTAGGGEKNNLSLHGGLGLFTATEDINVGGTIGDTDELGTEFDVTLTYAYSKAVSMEVTVAFLFGSEVLEGITAPEDEDSTSLFSIGLNGKF
jgi:hypothetical protein